MDKKQMLAQKIAASVQKIKDKKNGKAEEKNIGEGEEKTIGEGEEKKIENQEEKKEARPPKERLTSKDMPEIDWTDKNFPGPIKLIHFKLQKLKGRIHGFSQKLVGGTFLLAIWLILKFTYKNRHFFQQENFRGIRYVNLTIGHIHYLEHTQ